MRKIRQTINIKEKIKYPELLRKYLKDGDAFLTIETTGLSPDRHRIISIGTGQIHEDMAEIMILFSDNKDDELTIIEEAMKLLADAERIITWNGDSFDLRFISRRSSVYGKKYSLPDSYDLRKVLSPLRRFIANDSMSMYSLLDNMGIADDKQPDGATIATMYRTFISTGEERYASPVTGHSIYKLTGIMNLMALHECLRLNMIHVSSLKIYDTTDRILIAGSTDIFMPAILTLRLTGITLIFSEKVFKGSFTMYDGRIRMYFPDPASYVRTIPDGNLIPKELSRSLPRDSYEKVNRDECYSLVRLPDDTSMTEKQLADYVHELVKM